MRSFRIEIIGACVAMAMGFLLLMMMTFLAPLADLLQADAGDQQPIRIGMSGAIYSLVVLGLGIYAFWNAKWSGLGLVVCALIGFFFAFRGPVIPLILLAAAGFCLGGWYKALKRSTSTST